MLMPFCAIMRSWSSTYAPDIVDPWSIISMVDITHKDISKIFYDNSEKTKGFPSQMLIAQRKVI